MARMSKQNVEILEIALARLEGVLAVDEVREALQGDAKLYLDSWVKPLIQAVILNGLGYYESGDYAYQAAREYSVVNRTIAEVPNCGSAFVKDVKRQLEQGKDARQLRREHFTASITSSHPNPIY